jgi:DNA-binding response OmpR family regulator
MPGAQFLANIFFRQINLVPPDPRRPVFPVLKMRLKSPAAAADNDWREPEKWTPENTRCSGRVRALLSYVAMGQEVFPMKILVADDNADSRLLLTDLLLQWGHEALGAEDGKAAWETLAGQNAPQLVILDWVMPRMDGVELCRRLRKKDCPNPPYIILLTSKARSQDVVMALEAGANDYLTKSCNFDELRARIQVGCRVLDLQTRLREQERLHGVLQMAGAVCHEMNQPLQIILTSTELLLAGLSPQDPNREIAVTIQNGVWRLGDVTRRIMSLAQARTHEYLGVENQIVDLNESP